MLPVTIRAHRSIFDTRLDRGAVHAFGELPADFLVALCTSAGYVPMIHTRASVHRGIYVVISVTAVAIRRFFTAARNRPPVNALLVRLDGMGDRDLMPGQKARITVTLGACIRQVFARDG